jgi:hypothetical protein
MNLIELRSTALRSAGLASLPTDRLSWTDVNEYINSQIQIGRVALSSAGIETITSEETYPIVAGQSIIESEAFVAARWLHIQDLAIKWTSAQPKALRARSLPRTRFLRSVREEDIFDVATSNDPIWCVVGAADSGDVEVAETIGKIEIAPTPTINYPEGIEVVGVKEQRVSSDSDIIPLPLNAQDDLATRVGAWITGRLEASQ